MMGAFLSGVGGKIVMGLLATGLVVTIYFYWQHVVTSRALAEARVKQIAELNQRLAQTVREKNETNAKFLALPDVRNRLCAVQGARSPCCQPVGECAP